MIKPLWMQPAFRVAGLVAAVLLLVALAAEPATARERSVTVTGPQGQTAEREVSREQGEVSSSTTGPDGQTAHRELSRGDGQTEATVTGPNGRQWRRVVERDAEGRQSTRTGPSGRSIVRQRQQGGNR
jgi:hypothetical protein